MKPHMLRATLIWRMQALQQHLRMPLDQPSSTTMTSYPDFPPPHAQLARTIYTCSCPPSCYSVHYGGTPCFDQHPCFKELSSNLIPIYRCSTSSTFQLEGSSASFFPSHNPLDIFPTALAGMHFRRFLSLRRDVMILRARTMLRLAVWDGFRRRFWHIAWGLGVPVVSLPGVRYRTIQIAFV